MHRKLNKIHKIKYIYLKKVHVYMFLHNGSIKSSAGIRTRLFSSPFLISTSSFLILAEPFQNDYVSACSTALRSATEKNKLGGYVTVPCPSKMTQRSSTVDGTISSDVTRLVIMKHIRKKYSLLKSRSVINSCNSFCKLVDTVNLDLKYCKNQLKKVDLYAN